MRHVAVALFAIALPSLAVMAQDSTAVESRNGLVVSVSAPASDVGAAILAKGGNAVDAAIATAFALAVTHPSAGNIGGGGFMIVRHPDGTATTFDYRERAPGKSTPTMYLGADGKIDRSLTASGWLASGVPGTVRGLEMAHRKFGKLPWAEVVKPAADLATEGWLLSRGLSRSLNSQLREADSTGRPGKMRRFPTSVAAYGKPGGGEWAEGDRIRLADLGRTLNAIATNGPDAFYTGWIADSIDANMARNGGIITKADLRDYKAVERAPVRGTFLGHEIIGMGPPSSGGIVMIQTLNLMERMGIAKVAAGSAEYYHRRIEAARRAYLDRARYLGDPDFVKVPVDRLISVAYADSLAKTISATQAAVSAELGADIVAPTQESDETTHFSVVDAAGMAVSNTYTLEAGFGSGVVVGGTGIILNNEMGDFNKKPGETNLTGDIGTPANLIAPGKRMLSSMSPAIVTRNGQLLLVTGSPGGRTIPNTVLDVILGVTLFKRDVRAAVDAPRIHHQWLPDTTTIEAIGVTPEVLAALRAMGHRAAVSRSAGQGDAHSIVFDAKTKTAWGANDRRSADSKASKPQK
jgi:gamma-glutamyltranspeptidase/glutathione hydrolase